MMNITLKWLKKNNFCFRHVVNLQRCSQREKKSKREYPHASFNTSLKMEEYNTAFFHFYIKLTLTAGILFYSFTSSQRILVPVWPLSHLFYILRHRQHLKRISTGKRIPVQLRQSPTILKREGGGGNSNKKKRRGKNLLKIDHSL